MCVFVYLTCFFFFFLKKLLITGFYCYPKCSKGVPGQSKRCPRAFLGLAAASSPSRGRSLSSGGQGRHDGVSKDQQGFLGELSKGQLRAPMRVEALSECLNLFRQALEVPAKQRPKAL